MATANTNTMPEGGAAKGGASPRLSVRGISKSFSGNTVLAGIDLDIYPGELVALLGENGAGKSTFSSILAGLIQPDAGTMQWEGSTLRAGLDRVRQSIPVSS